MRTYQGNKFKAAKIDRNSYNVELIFNNHPDLFSQIITEEEANKLFTTEQINSFFDSFEIIESPCYGEIKRYLPVKI